MVSVDNLRWAAGFFDGDGCVLVNKTNTLQVTVTQAVTYRTNLDELSRLFGGVVKQRAVPQKQTHNQTYRWDICGKKAIAFCKQIEPYAVLKRPQVLLGASHRVEDKLGAGETLKVMKRLVHDAVTTDLSPAYTAGFLDADGCLRLDTGIRFSAVQKYPAILYALGQMYGGRVKQDKRATAAWEWTVHGDSARHCLKETLPFFVGKLPQAEALATLGAHNRDIVRATITALKMRKKKPLPVLLESGGDSSLPMY